MSIAEALPGGLQDLWGKGLWYRWGGSGALGWGREKNAFPGTLRAGSCHLPGRQQEDGFRGNNSERVFAYLFAFGFQKNLQPHPRCLCFLPHGFPPSCSTLAPLCPAQERERMLGLGSGPAGLLRLGTVGRPAPGRHPRRLLSPGARRQVTGLLPHEPSTQLAHSQV